MLVINNHVLNLLQKKFCSSIVGRKSERTDTGAGKSRGCHEVSSQKINPPTLGLLL